MYENSSFKLQNSENDLYQSEQENCHFPAWIRKKSLFKHLGFENDLSQI